MLLPSQFRHVSFYEHPRAWAIDGLGVMHACPSSYGHIYLHNWKCGRFMPLWRGW